MRRGWHRDGSSSRVWARARPLLDTRATRGEAFDGPRRRCRRRGSRERLPRRATLKRPRVQDRAHAYPASRSADDEGAHAPGACMSHVAASLLLRPETLVGGFPRLSTRRWVRRVQKCERSRVRVDARRARPSRQAASTCGKRGGDQREDAMGRAPAMRDGRGFAKYECLNHRGTDRHAIPAARCAPGGLSAASRRSRLPPGGSSRPRTLGVIADRSAIAG
jgi:hypothetical protein